MDARSKAEKVLWDVLGAPLYYCEECLLEVKVKTVDGEHIVTRKCKHTGQIIAPRRSILAGKGGLNLPNKIKMAGYKMAASITGRCV